MTLTSQRCRAKVKVKVKGQIAKAICSALAPDLKKLEQENERLQLRVSGPLLIFSVQTDDLASLRANLNSYLRLLDMAHRCLTV
jgi:tRNA threonylcarbamoyladenosine modification (KEOPS) complex  Pcc1 subunit